MSESAEEQDRRFMGMAIDEARQTDYPFGAVITLDGAVLARGRNSGSALRDPTAHGEMVTIHAFLAEHGPERLRGTTLYTSGEPCPMCMGAILWCGIGRLVYAASIPQIATRMNQIMIRCEAIAAEAFAPISITGGVMDAEAMALFGSGVTIYHNPSCGTSRATLAAIRAAGIEPRVVEYLKTPPGRAELAGLIERAGLAPRRLLREKEKMFAGLGLDDPALTDEQLIDAMLAHPVLINRPLVASPKGVRLCRPSELVLDLLP